MLTEAMRENENFWYLKNYCENVRTKVLYMKVETTFLSLKVESILQLKGEVDRIGLSHSEAV